MARWGRAVLVIGLIVGASAAYARPISRRSWVYTTSAEFLRGSAPEPRVFEPPREQFVGEEVPYGIKAHLDSGHPWVCLLPGFGGSYDSERARYLSDVVYRMG